MKFYAKTDMGKKYKTNEDYFILPTSKKIIGLSKIDYKLGYLFLLCDGMGGVNAGEVASNLTANWIFRDYYKLGSKGYSLQRLMKKIKQIFRNTDQQDNIVQIASRIKKIIEEVNARIYILSQKHEEYTNMGTTLVSSVIIKNRIILHSVGDSRCYRFRKGNLIQLTEDQSEVWEIYKIGAITKDEIRGHPRNNIINFAIGTEHKVKINEYVYEVNKKDLYLICSDGLSDMVSDDEIEKILGSSLSLTKKCKVLIQAANDAGGKDNITVILILK
jgi:protein phosphatase